VKQDPPRTCAALVDLPDIVVLRADRDGSMLEVHVETGATSAGCPDCGVLARVKERVVVKYCDLPVYGVASTLFWHKRRWRCAERDCPKKT
jgi:transposase